jgi:hypothetical protein
MRYRSIEIDGLGISYREAGPRDASRPLITGPCR